MFSGMSLPPMALFERLQELREQGDRPAFHALGDQIHAQSPEALWSLLMPRLRPEDRSLLLALGEAISLRPNFARLGVTLKIRSQAAVQALTLIGPDLGPGLVRMVITPGVGREGLPELLGCLPTERLAELRMDENGVRDRQPQVKRGPGNVIHLGLLGDNRLMEALKALPALRDLRLCENRIAKEGASYLAAMPLRKLDLRANPVGNAGAIRLSASKTLRVLKLADCGIGAAGVVALSNLPQLLELDLSGNSLGPEGVRALSHTDGLLRLTLGGCVLEEDQISRLRSAIPELRC
ncbi:MAG: hypothetical protein ACI9VR_001142 [Cognaticolwellia sp.]|jgi:hypothetical protein